MFRELCTDRLCVAVEVLGGKVVRWERWRRRLYNTSSVLGNQVFHDKLGFHFLFLRLPLFMLSSVFLTIQHFSLKSFVVKWKIELSSKTWFLKTCSLRNPVVCVVYIFFTVCSIFSKGESHTCPLLPCWLGSP